MGKNAIKYELEKNCAKKGQGKKYIIKLSKPLKYNDYVT